MSGRLIEKKEGPTKGAEREKFLNRKSHPARLTAEETALALGFERHEITVLIAKGLLKPLGRPVPNTMKWFATVTIEELRHDVNWLSRATDAIRQNWREKNARRTAPGERLSAEGEYQTAGSAD